MLCSRSFQRGLTIILITTTALAFAQTPVAVDEADPVVKTWEPPELPAELQKAKLAGEVVVEFVVDEHGAVTSAKVASSSDARLDAAALSSVQRWTFEPAISERRVVPCAMRVPVVFRAGKTPRRELLPPVAPQVLPRTSPRLVRRGPLAEPPVVEARKLGGTVVFQFVVDPSGRATGVQVLATESAELVRPSLDALRRSEFEPARQGELAVPATLQAPFEFTSFGENRRQLLELNGIAPARGGSWGDFDVLPAPQAYAEPVHPYEALLAGRAGEAEVEFTVASSGSVVKVEVVSASEPDFGAALAAAVRCWTFRPARGSEGNMEARLAMKHRFALPEEGANDAQARLVALLAPGGAGIAGARGLDARLMPVYRVAPLSPELPREGGASAEIEFIIDREGRARLPRVRSASPAEFGWAAAVAVAQWVFERPTRGGEPTDVRVAIPFSYKP
ncbi:MAG TPA: TonB family protein [Opitutaceae bacterium]